MGMRCNCTIKLHWIVWRERTVCLSRWGKCKLTLTVAVSKTCCTWVRSYWRARARKRNHLWVNSTACRKAKTCLWNWQRYCQRKFVNTSAHTRTHTTHTYRTHTDTQTHAHIHLHTHTITHTITYTHTHTHTHTYTYTYTYININIYIYTIIDHIIVTPQFVQRNRNNTRWDKEEVIYIYVDYFAQSAEQLVTSSRFMPSPNFSIIGRGGKRSPEYHNDVTSHHRDKRPRSAPQYQQKRSNVSAHIQPFAR